MMTSKAIKELLTDIDFNTYDFDFEKYVEYISNQVKKYDYQSVIDNICNFLKVDYKNNKDTLTNLYAFFVSRMNAKSFKPKLTEIDQIKKEQNEHKEFDELIKSVGFEPRPPKTEEELRHVSNLRYKHYCGSYLLKVANERKCSVSRLCEIQGLIPSSIIY